MNLYHIGGGMLWITTLAKYFFLTRAETRVGWFMIFNVLICFDLVVDVWMCLFDLILDLKFIRRLSFKIWFMDFGFCSWLKSLLARSIEFRFSSLFSYEFIWLVRFVWFIKRSGTFGNILIFLAQSVYVNRRNFYSFPKGINPFVSLLFHFRASQLSWPLAIVFLFDFNPSSLFLFGLLLYPFLPIVLINYHIIDLSHACWSSRDRSSFVELFSSNPHTSLLLPPVRWANRRAPFQCIW